MTRYKGPKMLLTKKNVDARPQAGTSGVTNCPMTSLPVNLEHSPHSREQYGPILYTCNSSCCRTDFHSRNLYSIHYNDIMTYVYYPNLAPDQKALHCKCHRYHNEFYANV